MASVSGSAVFYAVLIAPGFVAVMTAISLSAIEGDIKQFVLLVWSLVTSLFIDTVFLAFYQWRNDPITEIDQVSNVLFQPHFRADYIFAIFLFSVLVGFLYSAGILVDVPGKLRAVVQSWMHVSYSPEQPWEDFMDETGWLRIKTSDNELYQGKVVSWSRAGRPREVRITNPERYFNDDIGYEAVGDPDNDTEMLFLDDDVDRLARLTTDIRPTLVQRISRRMRSIGSDTGAESEDDSDQDTE